MRVLIRDKSNGLFLGRSEAWVKQMREAHDFGGAVSAISYASARSLVNIELVHAFPDEQYNFTLPMGDFDSPNGANGTSGNGSNNGATDNNNSAAA